MDELAKFPIPASIAAVGDGKGDADDVIEGEEEEEENGGEEKKEHDGEEKKDGETKDEVVETKHDNKAPKPAKAAPPAKPKAKAKGKGKGAEEEGRELTAEEQAARAAAEAAEAARAQRRYERPWLWEDERREDTDYAAIDALLAGVPALACPASQAEEDARFAAEVEAAEARRAAYNDACEAGDEEEMLLARRDFAAALFSDRARGSAQLRPASSFPLRALSAIFRQGDGSDDEDSPLHPAFALRDHAFVSLNLEWVAPSHFKSGDFRTHSTRVSGLMPSAEAIEEHCRMMDLDGDGEVTEAEMVAFGGAGAGGGGAPFEVLLARLLPERPVKIFRGAFSRIGAESGGTDPHGALSSSDQISAPL